MRKTVKITIFFICCCIFFSINSVQAIGENQEEKGTQEIKKEVASFFQKMENYSFMEKKIVSSKEERNPFNELSDLSVKEEKVISENDIIDSSIKQIDKKDRESFFLGKFLDNVKNILLFN